MKIKVEVECVYCGEIIEGVEDYTTEIPILWAPCLYCGNLNDGTTGWKVKNLIREGNNDPIEKS